MRFIRKGEEPHALRNWKRENQDTPQNLQYGAGGFPRNDVKQSLLREQHYLCAYTMRALAGSDDCHIEHFLPQSRGNTQETIDYANMLACYPSSAKNCGYGARKKADHDPEIQPICSPLREDTPGMFRFDRFGEIHGLTEQACRTIDVLGLNHPVLKNDRYATIKGRLNPKGRPLSAAQAKWLAQDIIRPDAQGRLPAFCNAVAQLAEMQAVQRERYAARMKGKRRQ